MKQLIIIFLTVVFFTSCKKFVSPNLKKATRVPFFLPQSGSIRLPVLILDAGHGGEDPGAINDSLQIQEKNVTRAIVDAMVKYIDPKKVKVIQTRPGKENVHRHDRIKFANANRPNLLVTVHINAAKDTTVNGYEVGYSDSLFVAYEGKDTVKKYNPYIDSLKKYSNLLLGKIGKNFPEMKRRGVVARKDDIWMIYGVNYPSLLVEFGFISNRQDVLVMKDQEKIKKIAKVLAQGIHEILEKKR